MRGFRRRKAALLSGKLPPMLRPITRHRLRPRPRNLQGFLSQQLSILGMVRRSPDKIITSSTRVVNMLTQSGKHASTNLGTLSPSNNPQCPLCCWPVAVHFDSSNRAHCLIRPLSIGDRGATVEMVEGPGWENDASHAARPPFWFPNYLHSERR